MFDPTVFDNLKVVLEGAMYDLDFNKDVEITDRSDIVDLAKMSRSYTLTLTQGKIDAIIELTTDALNWSGEILAPEQGNYPCQIYIEFLLKVADIDQDCSAIRFRLNQIWRSFKPKIEQNISFVYGNTAPLFDNQIVLSFKDDLGEAFIADIPFLIEKLVTTLSALEIHAK